MEISEQIEPSVDFKGLFDQHRNKAKFLRLAPVKDRISKLRSLKQWIFDHRSDIHDALFLDFKKPSAEVDMSEIQPVTAEIKHTIKNINKWTRRKNVQATATMLGTKAFIYFEPKGTSLIIAPWNFPFNLTISPLVHAISAGCTAIIKPSEMTPHTSQLMQEMVADLFDEREVVILQGEAALSTQLLELPFDHIFFTGSPEIGKIVMKAAAVNLSSVTLELGGKSPVIIDETANINDTARKMAWGKFLNCGQTCIAPDYVLVHKSVETKLLAALEAHVREMFGQEDKGISESADYARIVNGNHFNRLSNLLGDAVESGANIAFGGKSDASQCFMAPTVLHDIPDGAQLMKEEIFGPILPVIPYYDLEEALSFINERPKALALYIFTKSKATANKILAATSAGGVCINDNILHFSHLNLPFGGINNSGIGKSHGHHGFMAFTHGKAVLRQRTGLTGISMFYPPYTPRVKKIIEFVLRFF